MLNIPSLKYLHGYTYALIKKIVTLEIMSLQVRNIF